MSVLTEVTVIVETCPGPGFTAGITQPIPGDDREQSLREIDTGHAGGTKFYCSGLYAAMFNYVPAEDVVAFLDALDWKHHTAVVVIDDEHDDEVQVLRYPRSA